MDNVINASLRTRVIEKPAGGNIKSLIQSESKIYDKTRTMPSNLKKSLKDDLFLVQNFDEVEKALSLSIDVGGIVIKASDNFLRFDGIVPVLS